jgi:hypothetical protein
VAKEKQTGEVDDIMGKLQCACSGKTGLRGVRNSLEVI